MNEENPRAQCDLCGKWRRIWDRDNNQLMFTLYSADLDLEWLQDGLEFNSLCVECHLLFGLVCPPYEEV